MPPAYERAIHAETPGVESFSRLIEDVTGHEPPLRTGGLAGHVGPATGAAFGVTNVRPVGSLPPSAA
jgi:hypothetical protein